MSVSPLSGCARHEPANAQPAVYLFHPQTTQSAPRSPGRVDRSAKLGEQGGHLGRLHGPTQRPTDDPPAHDLVRTAGMQIAPSSGQTKVVIENHTGIGFHPGQPDQLGAGHRSPAAEAGSHRLTHGQESRPTTDPQLTLSKARARP